MSFFSHIRAIPKNRPSFLPRACALFMAGLAAGVLIKLLDLYTQNLGNLFSQMSVWIFLGALIAVNSLSPCRAAASVFLAAAGMLIAYYLTAELTHSVYSTVFLWGWGLFSCFTPLFAVAAWYAPGRGRLAGLLTAGILAGLLLCAALLFSIGLEDLLLLAATALVLLQKKRALRQRPTRGE